MMKHYMEKNRKGPETVSKGSVGSMLNDMHRNYERLLVGYK